MKAFHALCTSTIELTCVSGSDCGQSPVYTSKLEGHQPVVRITLTDMALLIDTWNNSASSLTNAHSSMMLPGKGMPPTFIFCWFFFLLGLGLLKVIIYFFIINCLHKFCCSWHFLCVSKFPFPFYIFSKVSSFLNIIPAWGNIRRVEFGGMKCWNRTNFSNIWNVCCSLIWICNIFIRFYFILCPFISFESLQ